MALKLGVRDSMMKSAFWIVLMSAVIIPTAAFAGGGGDESGHAVITHIALCMVFASVFGFIMKLLKQPLILAYLLAGVAIGPIGLRLITDQSDIATIAEIGLILLLFMIGLEIDLKKMLAAGKMVIVSGLFQFPICVFLGIAFFKGAGLAGISVGSGEYAVLYVSIAISISSTMIVVKLLYEKMELDTLPGRITLGILVFQDIWAIITLAIQPNLANPQILGIAKTLGTGVALIGVALLCSQYVLPKLFKAVAKVPELMLVMSLGWCFLVCIVAAHEKVGLSMEMGALIAGVTLATFPYNLDVIAKVTNIRDFFITLFFVALGMQIPFPSFNVMGLALLIAFAVVFVRIFGIFGVLYLLKGGHRTSLLCTINLGQMSEFSLVILTLGASKFNHISNDILTTIIMSFSILAVLSTYKLTYSHQLQRWLSGILTKIGIKDVGGNEEKAAIHEERPMVILGFYRIASAFIEELRTCNSPLIKEIMVVDFNPEVHSKLKELDIPAVYGDLSSPDTLHHAGIHHAKVVICSLPDYILKGTSNQKLLTLVRGICPEAKIIVTSESPAMTKYLYEHGADFVIQSSHAAGVSVVFAAEKALSGQLDNLSNAAKKGLEESKEILG